MPPERQAAAVASLEANDGDVANPRMIKTLSHQSSLLRIAAVVGCAWSAAVTAAEGDAVWKGQYAVVVKGLLPTGIHFVRLALLELNASGQARQNFWYWQSDDRTADRYGDTGRVIGRSAAADPAVTSDAAAQVQGATKFLSPPKVMSGHWRAVGNGFEVRWAADDTERWALAFGDGRLRKLELASASYLVGPTYLNARADATKKAVNVGWAFGPSLANSVGSTVAAALTKNLSGQLLRFNSWSCRNEAVADDELNLKTYFTATPGGVARFVSLDAAQSLKVYHYYAKPVAANGARARSVIYQVSHDFNSNQRIDDDGGHTYAGLEIIDATGAFRGVVFADASKNETGNCPGSPNTISAEYFVDDACFAGGSKICR